MFKHKRNQHWKEWPRHSPRRLNGWEHHHEPPYWLRSAEDKRGVLFLRFLGILSLVILLVAGGMAALAYLLVKLAGGGGQVALLVWLGGCGLSLALPMLAAIIAARSFHTIAKPLTDLMAATEAVSKGDLSVQVQTPDAPDDFQRLSESFNRMVNELARADRQRRNLTADVAHELRTPLQVIQGNLEGVLDGVYQPTPEHLQSTLDETQLLARLVDDLRLLSLAEEGELPLKFETASVSELLEDVITSFSGQAEAAGVNLHSQVDVEPGETLHASMDIDRMSQVLGNLLINALRHTPSGGEISLHACAIPNGVRIQVSDSGEGIPVGDLPYIFDRFWRGDRSRSHASGTGSGLGLAIARQLVQAHGGSINVTSQEGAGTTFTIELSQ